MRVAVLYVIALAVGVFAVLQHLSDTEEAEQQWHDQSVWVK